MAAALPKLVQLGMAYLNCLSVSTHSHKPIIPSDKSFERQQHIHGIKHEVTSWKQAKTSKIRHGKVHGLIMLSINHLNKD